MLEYDPTNSLKQYPMPMRRFGLTPFGDPLYRIVWAPSRRGLTGGLWPDGKAEYRWTPLYAASGNAWILERWLSAQEYTQCSPAEWEARYKDPASGFLLMGPYPSRGEYQLVHQFICAVSDANVGKLVSWIEAGRKKSFFENRVACKEEYERGEVDKRAKIDAIVRNALPAFGTAPMSGYKGGRGTKTPPLQKWAHEIGLPVRSTPFVQRESRPA